jgi:hypothetical protein
MLQAATAVVKQTASAAIELGDALGTVKHSQKNVERMK